MQKLFAIFRVDPDTPKGRTFRSITFLKRVSRQDAKHAKERFLIPRAILAALRENSAIRIEAPLAAAPIGTRLPWFERELGNVPLFACPQFSCPQFSAIGKGRCSVQREDKDQDAPN